jgi:hypothetical protein
VTTKSGSGGPGARNSRSGEQPVERRDKNRAVSYVQPPTVSRPDAERIFKSGDEYAICTALIGCALDVNVDGDWLQARIEELSIHELVAVRRASAVALGHLARNKGEVDTAIAMRVLTKLRADPTTKAAASDAMDDIARYAK